VAVGGRVGGWWVRCHSTVHLESIGAVALSCGGQPMHGGPAASFPWRTFCLVLAGGETVVCVAQRDEAAELWCVRRAEAITVIVNPIGR
jgi:hypothetical protein